MLILTLSTFFQYTKMRKANRKFKNIYSSSRTSYNVEQSIDIWQNTRAKVLAYRIQESMQI